MLTNCAPFIECASEINRSCKRSGFCDMIPIYNLIKKSDNYKCLWQYYRDEPALDNNTITNFPGNSVSLKYKVKITGKTLTDGNTKDVKIAVPLKNNY